MNVQWLKETMHSRKPRRFRIPITAGSVPESDGLTAYVSFHKQLRNDSNAENELVIGSCFRESSKLKFVHLRIRFPLYSTEARC